MRKLIIAGIISVVAMIAWISYLKYDTKRFIEQLSLSSQGEKQQLNDTVANSTVKDTEVTMQDNGANTKQSQLENTSTTLLEGESEFGEQPLDAAPNVKTQHDVLDSDPTLSTHRLSPEMLAIYSELNVLYNQYVRVTKEFIPLSKQLAENTKLYNNYGQEYQSAFGNIEKVDELEAEFDDLVAWLKENTPIYQRLLDETYSLSEKMETILKSRGFTSDEFDWKAYVTWHNEQ